MGLTLQRAAVELTDPAQVGRVENALTEIDAVIGSVRTTIYRLRPSASPLP